MKAGKLVSLTAVRQRKKKRTPEEAAQAAMRLILDKVPSNVQEPKGFASGGDMATVLTDNFDEEANHET